MKQAQLAALLIDKLKEKRINDMIDGVAANDHRI